MHLYYLLYKKRKYIISKHMITRQMFQEGTSADVSFDFTFSPPGSLLPYFGSQHAKMGADIVYRPLCVYSMKRWEKCSNA